MCVLHIINRSGVRQPYPFSNKIALRYYQSGAWSAGHGNMRGTSTKFQREHDKKKKKRPTKPTKRRKE